MLDFLRIRADFPLLAQRENGHRLVYLDNAATTQKPQAVLDAIIEYYRTTNANVHRGAYGLAIRATEAYEAARKEGATDRNITLALATAYTDLGRCDEAATLLTGDTAVAPNERARVLARCTRP